MGTVKTMVVFFLFTWMVPHVSAARPKGKSKFLADTTSSVGPRSWYRAKPDMWRWVDYARAFSGPRDLHCLDLFSGGASISRMWRGNGYRSCCFDIKTDASCDATTRDGFKIMVDLGLRLLGVQSIVMAGPPCSMFGFWTSSQHKRSRSNPLGNTKDRCTKLGNLIAENFGVFLLILFHAFGADMFPMLVVEQPRGSWMYKLPIFEKATGIVQVLGLVATATFMGAFGHVMQKPTTLLANFAAASKLARRLTPWQKACIRRRQEKAGLDLYRKHADGSVSGGRDLSLSAEYTLKFSQALFRLWLREFVQLEVFEIDP